MIIMNWDYRVDQNEFDLSSMNSYSKGASAQTLTIKVQQNSTRDTVLLANKVHVDEEAFYAQHQGMFCSWDQDRFLGPDGLARGLLTQAPSL